MSLTIFSFWNSNIIDINLSSLSKLTVFMACLYPWKITKISKWKNEIGNVREGISKTKIQNYYSPQSLHTFYHLSNAPMLIEYKSGLALPYVKSKILLKIERISNIVSVDCICSQFILLFYHNKSISTFSINSLHYSK